MDGTDVCVGMTVQFREGYESEPVAAIVTAVGVDRIEVILFHHKTALPMPRTGILHSSNPEARKYIVANQENDEGGIWDYVERQPPQEIDRSKEKPRKEKPASQLKDVASVG